jgi:hypothetical protein
LKFIRRSWPQGPDALRAGVSITSNTSEGCERKPDAECTWFLHISQGSPSELIALLAIAKEFFLIPEALFVPADEQGAIKPEQSLRTSSNQGSNLNEPNQVAVLPIHPFTVSPFR